MIEQDYITASVEMAYPKMSVEDLLASFKSLKEDQQKADAMLLDALVDLVNRSPYQPPQWATRMGVEIVAFVETCHRVRPVTNQFREKVYGFFRPFKDRWSRGEQMEWSAFGIV